MAARSIPKLAAARATTRTTPKYKASVDLTIQADAVERISVACIQALVVAARDAAEQGNSFAILRPSEVLADACEDLGLAGWLKQWRRA